MLDLGHGHPAGHCRERVEVAGRLAEHQVSVAVTLPGPDQAEIARDGVLQDEGPGLPVELHLLGELRRALDYRAAVGPETPRQAALGDLAADAGRGEERRDARATGAQLLRQSALR